MRSLLARGGRRAPRRINVMSGHSKWRGSNTRRRSWTARRGAQFTKLARAITVAAREGGGTRIPTRRSPTRCRGQGRLDAEDNIERAIAKGTGAGADADAIETVLYEGYGPGGVALLIEAYTDNRNRTGADVRHLLSKYGGNLGEPGSVSYLFEKRGLVLVDARATARTICSWRRGRAEDIVTDEDALEVYTAPSDLSAVRSAIEGAGVEIESAEVIQRPSMRVELDEAAAGRLFRLIEALETTTTSAPCTRTSRSRTRFSRRLPAEDTARNARKLREFERLRAVSHSRVLRWPTWPNLRPGPEDRGPRSRGESRAAATSSASLFGASPSANSVGLEK